MGLEALTGTRPDGARLIYAAQLDELKGSVG